MKILFSPQFRDDALTLVKTGETLIVNGDDFNFSGLANGYRMSGPDLPSEFLLSAERDDAGELTIAVLLPYAVETPEAAFPAPVVDPPDGPIALPNGANNG